MVDEVVALVVSVHVDDILVGEGKRACDKLPSILNQTFPACNPGEVQ